MFVALLFPIFLDTTAFADFMNGNDAYERCRSRTEACAGMMMAATDMLTYFQGRKNVCMPGKVSVAQLRDVFLRHLEAQPELRHMNFNHLFYQAMNKAFPC